MGVKEKKGIMLTEQQNCTTRATQKILALQAAEVHTSTNNSEEPSSFIPQRLTNSVSSFIPQGLTNAVNCQSKPEGTKKSSEHGTDQHGTDQHGTDQFDQIDIESIAGGSWIFWINAACLTFLGAFAACFITQHDDYQYSYSYWEREDVYHDKRTRFEWVTLITLLVTIFFPDIKDNPIRLNNLRSFHLLT